jgi:hypothetical protein
MDLPTKSSGDPLVNWPPVTPPICRSADVVSAFASDDRLEPYDERGRAMGRTRRIFVGVAAALLMALLHSSSAQAAYVCYSTDQDRWVCHATP